MKDIKSRCRIAALKYILLPLYRVAKRLDLYTYETTLKTAVLLMRYVALVIRESEVIATDEEDKVDLIVVTLIARILTPELFLANHKHREPAERFFTNETITEVRSEINENHELIQRLSSRLMDNPVIIECMCQFWLTLHLGCLITKDLEYAEYNMSRVHELDDSAKPLRPRDVNSIHRNTNRKISQFKKLAIDRESDKFDVTASELIKFLSFIAALLIPTAGYLYNYFLLAPFGIDSSNYFTIPDYVASSITAIRESLSSMLFFFVGIVVSEMRGSRKRAQEVLYSKYRISISVKQPLPRWLGWCLLICSIVLSMALYYIGSSSYYSLVGLSGMSILVMAVDRCVFRYFKRPTAIRSVVIAIALFSTALWSSASSRVYELKMGIEHDSKNYTIHLEQEHLLPSNDLIILSSTSKYYIFITRELRVYVLDRESIKHIEIKTDQHWLRDVFDSITL